MRQFIINPDSKTAKFEAAGESKHIRRPARLLTTGTHFDGQKNHTFSKDDLETIVNNTKIRAAGGQMPKLRVKHSMNSWDHIGYILPDTLQLAENGNSITGVLEVRDANARQKIDNGLWEPGKQALSVGVYGTSEADQYLSEVSIVETGACPEAVMLENNDENGGNTMSGKAKDIETPATAEAGKAAEKENQELKAALEKQGKELEEIKKAQSELISKITSAFGGGQDAKALLEKQDPAQAMSLLGSTVEKIAEKMENIVKESQGIKAELEAEKSARRKEADAKTIEGFVMAGKIAPAVKAQELEMFMLMPDNARKIYLEKMAKTPAMLQLAGSPLDKPEATDEDTAFFAELEKVAESRGIKLQKS